jgi:hypothetical protein
MKTFGLCCFPTWKALSVATVVFFVFCQVIGLMCAVPDVSTAGERLVLSEDGITCPMDGAIMCPPSVTSSPERQLKAGMVMDVDHGAMIRLNPSADLRTRSVSTLWTWSSVPSIVPVFIESSSVLRI